VNVNQWSLEYSINYINEPVQGMEYKLNNSQLICNEIKIFKILCFRKLAEKRIL
jgi:hypothetical protein